MMSNALTPNGAPTSLGQFPHVTLPSSPDMASPDTARGILSGAICSLGIRHAVLDLDLTLIDSRPLYIDLEISTCRAFGFTDREEIIKVHHQLISRSSREIMAGLYDLCGGERIGAPFEEFFENFRSRVKALHRGESAYDFKSLPLINHADELLRALYQQNLSVEIATGSSRSMAELLIRSTRLSEIFAPDGRISTSDCTPFTKDKKEFWDHIMGPRNPDCCMGFEDNYEAACWMLEHGNFRQVFLLSESPSLQVTELQKRFPVRLQVVQSWKELL